MDFIRAALPWIVIGLLLAVNFARSAGKKKKENSLTMMEPRECAWVGALE